MEKKSQSMLIVVSCLTGRGPTGVETHFNLIMEYAASKGIETLLVMPHDTHWLLRKPANAIGRLLKLFNPEYSTIWNRMVSYRRLKNKLRFVLANNASRVITLYAQDPLSAAAALDTRKSSNCRVVAVSHFNLSEASEVVVKGLTTEGSALWRELMRLERSSLPRVDQLIFVSKFMSQVVNQRLPQLSQVPQAIIANFSSKPVEANLVDAVLTGDLISIGTLEPRKNQGYLLQVLAACNKYKKKYLLTLVGSGPDRQWLAQLAASLGVGAQVNFLEFMPNAARLIANHRIVVHAAEMENMPLTLIESLSYGRPILAAAVGGIPEIFADGEEGHFWNLSDPEGAAEILINLLDNPMQWQRMSERARLTFQARFHPDMLAARWLNTIMSLTAGQHYAKESQSINLEKNF